MDNENLPDPFGPAMTSKRFLPSLSIRTALYAIFLRTFQILRGNRIENTSVIEYGSRTYFLHSFLVLFTGCKRLHVLTT